MHDAATDDMALEIFAGERPRLLGLAYRMLGSLADAEDVLQETWLRWQLADRSRIERPPAWLTTVASRCCLDRMKSAARQREDYIGPWLPEPIALERGPAEEAEMAETLAMGFLVMLDRLKPIERLVFLLADVFGSKYKEIASITGRSEAACRQIAHRARLALQAEPPSRAPSDADDTLIVLLIAAVTGGDMGAAVELLAPDVMLVSDGGRDHRAARRPVVTPTRVARLLVNLAKRMQPSWTVQPCRLNGRAGLVFNDEQGPQMAIVFEPADGKVRRIWTVLAPAKLGHLSETTPMI